MWRYDGRRAVVTGCASGIGAQVVEQLTELGAHVVGLDRQPPSGEIDEFHVNADGSLTSLGTVAGLGVVNGAYRPNVVLIGTKGEVDVIREAEDLSDIVRRERMPARLDDGARHEQNGEDEIPLQKNRIT